MRKLLAALQSHIRYRIILPYLALTLVVMMAGSAIAVGLVAASWEERLINQLAQIARSTADALVQRERKHIDFLSQIAFAPPQEQAGALSTVDAFVSRDPREVAKTLEAYYEYGISRIDLDFDRLIAFDISGKALLDWQRVSDDPRQPPFRNEGTDLSQVDVVQQIIRGTDAKGNDKFSGLFQFTSDPQPYFYTIVPIKQPSERGGAVLGGVLIGVKVDRLLAALEKIGQAAVTTFYDINGTPIGSTLVPRGNIEILRMNETVLQRLASGQAQSIFSLSSLGQDTEISLDTIQFQQRGYQLAYSPLLIADKQVGYFSVGLSRDFQVQALSLSRNAIIGIALALALGAVLLGFWIARSITQPLAALVATAEAVAAGNLERRTPVYAADELGQLAHAFNQMTEHLLRLYMTSRELSASIEIDPVLDVTARTIQGFLPETEVLALLEERDGWSYRLRPNAPAELAELARVRVEADNPLLHDLAEAGAPRVLAPADEPRLESLGLTDIARFESLLLTPLVVQDALAGLLIFGHRQARAFEGALGPTLLSVGNMATSVLYNAILFNRIHEEASKRQAILQSIADGVIVCDEQRNIVLVNDAAERMLKRSYDDLVRRNFNQLPLRHVEIKRDDLGSDSPDIEHYELDDLVARLSSAPVISEGGQVLGEVIVLHDISAEAAVDRAKTKFIETVSHELRTPLTPICGNTELLLRGYIGELNPDQRDMLEVVRKRAEQMRDLVNNFVMIASIDANTIHTEPEPQDVWPAIELAVAPMRSAFAKKGLELQLDVPEGLPPVMADREQLRVVLTQLLDNARRYTQQGSVTVSARADEGRVRFDIADTGPGIPAEEFDKLFTRFHRVEGNNSPERGGGLGLVIARRLVERQGGQIWATSEIGQGSTFSFALLAAHEHADAVARSDSSDTAA